MTIDRDALRSAVGSVLVNASNFPAKVQSRLLGQDMTPLVDKTTESLAAILPTVQADAVHEAAEAVRRHATAPYELCHPTVQIDKIVAWVADWIENPPDWVEVSYRKVASE